MSQFDQVAGSSELNPRDQIKAKLELVEGRIEILDRDIFPNIPEDLMVGGERLRVLLAREVTYIEDLIKSSLELNKIK